MNTQRWSFSEPRISTKLLVLSPVSSLAPFVAINAYLAPRASLRSVFLATLNTRFCSNLRLRNIVIQLPRCANTFEERRLASGPACDDLCFNFGPGSDAEFRGQCSKFGCERLREVAGSWSKFMGESLNASADEVTQE